MSVNKIIRKLYSLYQLMIKNRLTRPFKVGEKILILACAPCVENFFKYNTVRQQFKDYDIAFINFMVTKSEKEMFDIKPRFIMLIDPVFYGNDPRWENEKKAVAEVLNKVNWECILVTSVLADFSFVNSNITIHRISCFEQKYRKMLLPLFRRNLVTLGLYNIMQATIYYAITFGYKKIAILGCNYQMAHMRVVDSGIQITDYMHYYDTETEYEYVTWEEIEKRKNGFVADAFARAQKSAACFYSLSKYAKDNGAEVTNYSDDSALDGFRNGKLNIEGNI